MAKVLSGWKARRYAYALLLSAVEAGELERVEGEVNALNDLLTRSPQLIKFLAQPLVPFAEKERLLRQRLDGRISAITLNFLLAIVKHKRIEAFGHIVRVFNEVLREYRGEVVAELRTAVPLTDEERSLVVRRLEAITGKRVLLSEKVDPSLIGGMRIVVGDKLLDLSLRGHLERFRERLRQVYLVPSAKEALVGNEQEAPNTSSEGEQP